MNNSTGIELSLNMTNENFDEHWGYLNYVEKTILDIGADIGSTAQYFLNCGATHVYAVEGDDDYFEQLELNADILGSITPFLLYVETPEDYCSLITRLRPDVVKIDIEGAEEHLLGVFNMILQTVPEYIIETHDDAVYENLVAKFQEAGFNVSYITYSNNLKILIAKF